MENGCFQFYMCKGHLAIITHCTHRIYSHDEAYHATLNSHYRDEQKADQKFGYEKWSILM